MPKSECRLPNEDRGGGMDPCDISLVSGGSLLIADTGRARWKAGK
jgi:hypothetical protein